MIPIGDRLRTGTFPYVNVTLIVLNLLLFFYELTLSTVARPFELTELDVFLYDWGAIPACLTDRFGGDPNVDPRAIGAFCDETRVLISPFSAMFLHGGWLHILGNMLFLWIFGDNVEDRFGHVRYLLFYLAGGLAATATHVAFNMDDLTPAIGASGAIAGVMGAYVVMFPRARVAVFIPVLWLLGAPYVPAFLLIGIWFLMQVWSGLITMGQASGVAWWAHVGGFVFGAAIGWLVAMLTAKAPRAGPRAFDPWRDG